MGLSTWYVYLTNKNTLWCGHEVQAPNYTNVWEEEQKEDAQLMALWMEPISYWACDLASLSI